MGSTYTQQSTNLSSPISSTSYCRESIGSEETSLSPRVPITTVAVFPSSFVFSSFSSAFSTVSSPSFTLTSHTKSKNDRDYFLSEALLRISNSERCFEDFGVLSFEIL